MSMGWKYSDSAGELGVGSWELGEKRPGALSRGPGVRGENIEHFKLHIENCKWGEARICRGACRDVLRHERERLGLFSFHFQFEFFNLQFAILSCPEG
jgi:hypothetical protein